MATTEMEANLQETVDRLRGILRKQGHEWPCEHADGAEACGHASASDCPVAVALLPLRRRHLLDRVRQAADVVRAAAPGTAERYEDSRQLVRAEMRGLVDLLIDVADLLESDMDAEGA